MEKNINTHFVIKGRNPSKLPESIIEEDLRKNVASEIKNKKQIPKRWWTKIKASKGSPSENPAEAGDEIEAMLKTMSSSLVVSKQKISRQSKLASL